MKNICLLFHIVTWDGRTKILTKLQGEGQMVSKMLAPKSDRVTLYAFARWWYVTNVVLGQFRQANTDISERNLKTVH